MPNEPTKEQRRAAAEALFPEHDSGSPLRGDLNLYIETGSINRDLGWHPKSCLLEGFTQAIAAEGARVLRDCVAAAEELRARRGTVTQLECLQASAIAALTHLLNAVDEKARTNG